MTFEKSGASVATGREGTSADFGYVGMLRCGYKGVVRMRVLVYSECQGREKYFGSTIRMQAQRERAFASASCPLTSLGLFNLNSYPRHLF